MVWFCFYAVMVWSLAYGGTMSIICASLFLDGVACIWCFDVVAGLTYSLLLLLLFFSYFSIFWLKL